MRLGVRLRPVREEKDDASVNERERRELEGRVERTNDRANEEICMWRGIEVEW